MSAVAATVTVDGRHMRVREISACLDALRTDRGQTLPFYPDGATAADAVWDRYLTLTARELCGRRAVVVTLGSSSWTSSGSMVTSELTAGIWDARERRYVDCRRTWVTRRRDEVDAAAAVVEAWRAERDARELAAR